jgi:S-adenosylmethionine hydrolase
VPPQDILCGAITLERAIDGFPPGTVHLAVVDPGVGTDRRILVARVNRQLVVCPDNGLLTWAWRRHGAGQAHELAWRPPRHSDVFHGRDIMAPAAGMLACGAAVESLARPIDDPVMLDIAPAGPTARCGQVIHVDHFGNATTNVSYDALKASPPKAVRIRGKRIGKLRRTYWDVEPGKPLALIGSSGLLEIAVRDGSAVEVLKVKVGDEVVVE